jgi:dihydroorotate dehydrogenase electron transfer subunit
MSTFDVHPVVSPVTVDFRLPTAVTIRSVAEENYRTRTLVLDASLDAYPGQFVMAWLPRFDEKPFSLVDADPVTLMVTAVGPFSRLIHTLRPGDRLWIRGPFGHGYRVPADQHRLALVGGGYGIAPLHWLARTQTGRASAITAILGARTADDILYADRFQALATTSPASRVTGHESRATRHTTLITTEDGSLGQAGLVTDALEPLLAAGEIDGVYACGPHGMLAALAGLGERYQVPCQLSWERYMRCGMGVCGACEHEGKLLCLDGPVLA